MYELFSERERKRLGGKDPEVFQYDKLPKGMGRGSTGPGVDQIFALEEQILDENELVLRADPVAPQVHAFVESASRVVLEQYEARLAETRPSWRKVWP